MNEITDEGIEQIERFSNAPELEKATVGNAISFVLKKIDENIEQFGDGFPAPVSIGNVYPVIGNIEWTSSFWTGMLWLAFELTGEKRYRECAEKDLESFKVRIETKDRTDTHDLGFLYTLSCVASCKLTKNDESKKTAIKAADLLVARYFKKAGIIQAWGDLDNANERGRMIIDCLMNLPLLYWASSVTGNRDYFDIAYDHAKTVAKYLIREDASSFHTYYMDVETGKPKYGKTNQGYSDDSCWARGQAWGIYGFPLSYLHTNDRNFIDISEKMTNYFLNRLPDDYVSYWDLVFRTGDEEKDSSASSIACCGLMELVKHLPSADPHKRVYENASKLILSSLINDYTTVDVPESNGILLHSVYSKPAKEGIDECSIWGDYFYFEALARSLKDWNSYW